MVGGGSQTPLDNSNYFDLHSKITEIRPRTPLQTKIPPPPKKKSKLVSVDDTVVNVWINLNLNILTFKRMMTSSPVLVPHYRIVIEERLNMWTFNVSCQVSCGIHSSHFWFLFFCLYKMTLSMFWLPVHTNVLNEKYHFKNKLKCEIKHSVYFLNNNDNDQLITN